MKNKNLSIFQETYLTVSPLSAEYFKRVWLKETGLAERTFRNRLIDPELDDLLLFCRVCKLDIGKTLEPFADKFKNIPAFGENLQLTMTVAQKETLLNAAVMISAAANVIESRIFKDSDEQLQETLVMCIENLGYQIADLNELLTDLKQVKQ